MIWMILWLGCPHTSPPATSGWFRDAACGDRAFPREIGLQGGTYVGRDLVSPCPMGATCMWSGIVEFKGTLTRDGDSLVLEETSAAPQVGPSPRPKRLTPKSSGWADENGCSFVPMDAGVMVDG
jgi:hypothetical protein